MLRLSELKLPLDHDEAALVAAILRRLRLPPAALRSHHLVKRSVDARRRGEISLVYSLDLELEPALEERLLRRHRADPHLRPSPDTTYRYVLEPGTGAPSHPRPVVVGAGPCGYFAALLLAQMGLRPLLLERGQPVKQRTADTFGFWRGARGFDPESNAQFGEGGAGTFSDGKLYSQVSEPRAYVRKVLEELVAAGANPEILTCIIPTSAPSSSRPWYGACGPGSRPSAGRCASGRGWRASCWMGPSGVCGGCGWPTARRSPPIRWCWRWATAPATPSPGCRSRGWPCSQALRRGPADRASPAPDRPGPLGRGGGPPPPRAGRVQARAPLRGRAHPGRSVYSFCMCPGGLVVGATSEEGCVVTNGMSQHSRNERNANSGLVVPVTIQDLAPWGTEPDDPLAGVAFQRHWEGKAFAAGGGDYRAPAQWLGDFLAGRPSTPCPPRGDGASPLEVAASYQPGVHFTSLEGCLPPVVLEAIREALPAFERRIPGYALPSALLTGVETRTSSPLRIPRDGGSFQSLNTPGLYPAGEGAGYAGGILSAAIDGLKVAEAVALARCPAAV